ncbi:hypothetical protein PF003_g19324 [Phytophthora fragariae]|nr:hypothetical protein PF003_g19324 [Phytophthora fragariae]
MGRDTKQRVRVRTNQVWSTDKASAAAPSSEDVVLAWLTTPGNMERWRGGRTSKLDLSEEIVRGLEANGIVTRSAVGVYEKIRYLEGGFITATADLIVKKKLNEFLRGEASAEVEKEIGWSASLYRELVPVFGKEVTGKKLPMVTVPERAPVTRAREVMASAAAVRAALGSANNKNKSPGTKNQKNAAGKWKENLEKSRAQEARPVEVKKEGVAAANGGGNEKERAPAAKEAEADAEMEDPDKEESDLDPAHTPRKRPTSDPSPAAKRYRRSSAVTRDLERETFIERAKQEQAQRQELFELERAKVECELQAKRVQLMMERSLARKTLLSAGVDPAEVDRVLPL